MEAYVNDILPFNETNTQEVIHEINMIVRSNAIGIPLLAIIQGGVAMIGYLLFGAPNILMLGFLTCFATIIPIGWYGIGMVSCSRLSCHQRRLVQRHRAFWLWGYRRIAIGQSHPVHPSKEDGGYASAYHYFWSSHRSADIRVYGSHLRSVAAFIILYFLWICSRKNISTCEITSHRDDETTEKLCTFAAVKTTLNLMETFTFNTVELILLSVAGILFIIQLIYYFGLYNRIHVHNKAVGKEEVHFIRELPPLSVILRARNEAENLRKILPAILEQDYPQFEVIVINDASTDDTEDILGVMEEKYPHLYHSFTPESARYISHKKLALTLGIKASKHDWLVFTETNCMPASNQWLKLMARNFTPQTQIVLGYSGYDRTKGWLHKRTAFDTLFQSLRYLGFALAGKPYIGIGRNLAYRKELFFQQKGFSKYLNLQRGEDDLFINELATSANTRVETDFNATTRIQPVYRYKDWKEEKVSYMATARFYHGIQRYLLGFETFSRLLFYIACIAGIVFGILNFHWLVAGIAFLMWLLRFTVQAVIINRTAKEMGGGRKYYFSLPVFDLIQPVQSLKFKLCRFFRGKGDFMRR